jgi:hypothetical protein
MCVAYGLTVRSRYTHQLEFISTSFRYSFF